MFFLAAGGSAKDKAKETTPATAAAHVIELTAGKDAQWKPSTMPYPRVMVRATQLPPALRLVTEQCASSGG